MGALSYGDVGLFGAAVGFAVGFFVRRARLCTFGAIEDVVEARDWRRSKVFGLSLALALLGSQTLVALGWLDPLQTTYANLRLPWLSVSIGAFLFGIGMALVGTCSFGSLVRMGGGDLRAFVVMLVFGLCAFMWLRGPLAVLRVDWLESVFVEVGTPRAGDPTPLAFAAFLAVALIVLVLRDRRLRRAPRMLTAGIVLGLSIPLAWLVTGALVDPFATDVRVQSLSFVAPVARGVHATLSGSREILDFGVMSVAGVALGALAAALHRAEFRWEAFDDEREMRRHLAGAALMGTGGVLAGGCTIGQGLTAGSLLSPTWPLAALGILAGARLGIAMLVEGSLREMLAARLERWRVAAGD